MIKFMGNTPYFSAYCREGFTNNVSRQGLYDFWSRTYF